MGAGCSGHSELHLLESPVDLLVEVIEVLPHLMLRSGWQLEFHVLEPVDDIILTILTAKS